MMQNDNENNGNSPWENIDQNSAPSSVDAMASTFEENQSLGGSTEKPPKRPLKNYLKVLRFLVPVLVLAVYLNLTPDMEGLYQNESLKINSPKIGLIKVEGVIMESSEVLSKLSSLSKDSDIKGIILKVDSPGGAVASSQEIYQKISEISQNKPVFVSMENVAASGGYYISLGANKIFANPGTLTGSIGVIFQTVNARKLLNNIGIEDITIKSGDKKDILSSFRDPTLEELDIMQTLIDDTYQQFVKAVSDSRGLSKDQVEIIADGRVYNGSQALDSGLIDGLKSYSEVVDEMRSEIGIPDAEIYSPNTTEDYIRELLNNSGISSGVLSWFSGIGRGPMLMAVMPGWR